MRFMFPVHRDIKKLCRDILFHCKSNVSTNFVVIERMCVATEFPAIAMRFYFSLSRQKEPMSQQKFKICHDRILSYLIFFSIFSYFQPFNPDDIMQ